MTHCNEHNTCILIHLADPQASPVVNHYFYTCCPSVPHLKIKLSNRYFTDGRTVDWPSGSVMMNFHKKFSLVFYP